MAYLRRLSRLALLVLLVVAGTLPQAASAQIEPLDGSADPPRGEPGTTFLFASSGFDGSNEIAYWLTMPNGETYGNAEDYRFTSEQDGSAIWEWTAPADAPPGEWGMVAQQIDRLKNVAYILFEVVPVGTLPAPPQAPDQTGVVPDEGAPGTSFAFAATGLEPGERAGYWFNTPGGEVLADTRRFTTFVDDAGRVEIVWTAPADSATGYWSLVVQGATSGHRQMIAFAIRA
jgi:hypothetical protein